MLRNFDNRLNAVIEENAKLREENTKLKQQRAIARPLFFFLFLFSDKRLQ